jgi:hypothetical protein
MYAKKIISNRSVFGVKRRVWKCFDIFLNPEKYEYKNLFLYSQKYKIVNITMYNVSNVIIIQQANTKYSVGQHGPPTNAKVGSGA